MLVCNTQLKQADCLLPAGLLCGGLTILQMMLLAETQVCTGLHGRATTLKALTIARRLYMPTMLHSRGRAHIKESVMGQCCHKEL